MLITIDTNHPTELDLKILRELVLEDYLTAEPGQKPTPDTGEAEAPKPARRPRRTKAQIEADEAAAKAAAEAPEPTEETPEPSKAEQLAVTIEEVREVGSQLVEKDRTKMRALLDDLGVRKLSEVPEDKLAQLAADIRAALA